MSLSVLPASMIQSCIVHQVFNQLIKFDVPRMMQPEHTWLVSLSSFSNSHFTSQYHPPPPRRPTMKLSQIAIFVAVFCVAQINAASPGDNDLIRGPYYVPRPN